MNEQKKINILIVDDNQGDIGLMIEMLKVIPRIEDIFQATKLSEGIKIGIEKFPDVVFLDLGLPDCQGIDTFKKFRKKLPGMPVILATGLDDEEIDNILLKMGAQDYLLKGKLNSDIISNSIRHSIERKKQEIEREKLILELQKALEEIRILKDLLSICGRCKKIKDENDKWVPIESYMLKYGGITFSHGLCPECYKVEMDNFFKKF